MILPVKGQSQMLSSAYHHPNSATPSEVNSKAAHTWSFLERCSACCLFQHTVLHHCFCHIGQPISYSVYFPGPIESKDPYCKYSSTPTIHKYILATHHVTIGSSPIPAYWNWPSEVKNNCHGLSHLDGPRHRRPLKAKQHNQGVSLDKESCSANLYWKTMPTELSEISILH